MLTLIQESFPEEYGPFETQLLRDASTGALNTQQVMERTSTFITAIQLRLLPDLPKASAAELKALMVQHVAATQVLQKYNLHACREFGAGRGSTMEMYASLPEEAVRALQAYSATEMRTAISGAKQKLRHAPLKDGALEPVVLRYEKAGGSLEFLAVMADPSSGVLTPAEHCRDTILWLQLISEESPELIASVLSAEED
ncbi:hypothetical protein [Caulobacter mirabilis]|uniref:hypothetical protein n=1 Tax=Caulobacter mirabilis TaxID=69666 RepID=UPI0012372766|nr:hypothetical protein [Caulobacter mirabilis]